MRWTPPPRNQSGQAAPCGTLRYVYIPSLMQHCLFLTLALVVAMGSGAGQLPTALTFFTQIRGRVNKRTQTTQQCKDNR